MPQNPGSMAGSVVQLAPAIPLITLMSYDGSNVEYIGKANPDTATDEPLWQIKKFTYDGSGNLESILTAHLGQFRGTWDNRASETYS